MYYVSRDDARSDLMLSAAVFVFGPFLFVVLLDAVGIFGLLGITGRQVLQLVIVAATTMLVPVLLMRYRNEPSAVVLGLGAGDRSVSLGGLAAVPLLLAGAALLVLAGTGDRMMQEHPIVWLQSGIPLGIGVRLLGWVGVLALALYVTVKARDAFAGEPRRVHEAVWRIGRILAIAAVVTTALVLLTVLPPSGSIGAMIGRVVWPLAVAASLWLILRRTDAAATTTMPALVAPTVIGALGNFTLSLFNPAELVFGLYAATLSGGIGLGVGLLAEGTRRGGGVVLLAVLIALGTGLPTPLRIL